MSKWITRSGVIAFWLLLIGIALYSPKWEVVQFEPRSINVFVWGDILNPSVVADFEKETGIKVYLNYYSSNEELLVKMKATRGEGYDLVIPSDYVVPLLVKDNLLKEIAKEKVFFYGDINPLLLNHRYDPENRHSLPFEWEIFGLGINKNYFKDKPFDPSWKAIFDREQIDYKITMINDPIESILLAAFYLYGPVQTLDPEQALNVKNLLFQQKSWVEAYADFRGDYFLVTGNCPIVVASSSYIWRAKRKFNYIDFAVPKEGSFLSIENIAIPAASQKEPLVYEFINYLFRMQSIKRHYDTYGFFPAILHPSFLQSLDPDEREIIQSSLSKFKKYHFTEVLLPYQEIQHLWVELKAE
ncbi:MAG: extracellular solute-binding protein [Chlamydiales bacterium]|nr:extracellular solute-binding protein [Chlamydiales bacterium]